MPVEYVVDSLDTVDESIRGAYVESEDGKFNFDADKYAEIKAQGLKTKNKELLTKIAQGKADKDALKRFEKFAELDDDELEELLTLRESKTNPPTDKDKQPKDSELQAQFEKALNKEKTKHSEAVAVKDARIAELEKENKYFRLTTPIRDAALKAGVLPEDIEVVMMETEKRFVETEPGKILLLDDDGDPTDVTPQKYFENAYKAARPKFYAPSGAGGSGAPSAVGTGGKQPKRSEMTAAQKAKYVRENGREKYLELPA